MSRKLDYLECAAERVHKERWELYQIKTMAEYLKEGESYGSVDLGRPSWRVLFNDLIMVRVH